MSNERYFNLHEDRQVVIDTIASCTKKGNFSGEDGYFNYAVPAHNMLLDALLISVPTLEKHLIFNRNISVPSKSMLYGVFTGSHQQRLLLSAIYAPSVNNLTFDERKESATQNMVTLDSLRMYIGSKYNVDNSDFGRNFNFSGFRTKSAASSNPVFGSFNKRVTLTGTVFFCDDIAELDEIGFFTIKESTNA